MERSPPGEKQDREGAGTNPYAVLSVRALSGFTPLHRKSQLKRQNRVTNGCSANLATRRCERSPKTYHMREQREFQREFTWFVWLLVLFALLHVAILVILLAVPK